MTTSQASCATAPMWVNEMGTQSETENENETIRTTTNNGTVHRQCERHFTKINRTITTHGRIIKVPMYRSIVCVERNGTTKKGYQTILHSMRDLRPFHLLLFIFGCAADDSLFFFFAFSRALIFQPIPVQRAWRNCTKLRGKLCRFFSVWSNWLLRLLYCYSNTYQPIFCTAISSPRKIRESNNEMRLENSALARSNTSRSLPTISILMSVVRIRQFILRCPSLYLSANVCHYGFM